MEWIQPMEPILHPDAISDAGFIHQVKWDGIRGLCYINNGGIRLFTKKGRERTPFYPELHEFPELLKHPEAILDGEIITFDEGDKPSFQLIQARERVNDSSKIKHYMKKYPAHYVVFDILSCKNRLLTSLPLEDRINILKDSFYPSERITSTDSFQDGASLFDLMRKKGWEGIVSKRITSPYTGGKHHRDWYKTKLVKKILAVVIGLSMKNNRPNSLVLGISRSNYLDYIGKASLGLTQEDLGLLNSSIPQLRSSIPLFKVSSPDFKDIIWLKPLLTCWVSFLERTKDGSLRHPKILGFSSEGPNAANGEEFMI